MFCHVLEGLGDQLIETGVSMGINTWEFVNRKTGWNARDTWVSSFHACTLLIASSE